MDKKIQNLIPKLRTTSTDNSSTSSTNSHAPKFSINSNLFNDNQVLPASSSTWSLTDKSHSKKIKQLLDPRFSPKARFQSLNEIIEGLPEIDIPDFFQEYPDEIFDTVVGMFVRQVNKVRDKGVTSINTKEMYTMFKTFPLFKKIFLFLPYKIREGWQESKFTAVLTQLLHFGNHPRLRLEGFQLLLIWLSILKEPRSSPIWLYRNAIPLDAYAIDTLDNTALGSNVDLVSEMGYSNIDQELIHANDRTPLIPRQIPHSFADSNILFEAAISHIIQLAFIAAGISLPSHISSQNNESPWNNPFPPSEYYICMGMDGANQAAKFMYELMLAYYLTKLFPKVVEKYDTNPNKKLGPPKCAPSILLILIKFFVQNCVDDGSKMIGLTASSLQIVPSPSCPILKRIIFSSEISRSFIFEILEQGLNLIPYGFSDKCMQIVKGSIILIQTWLFSDESEKPIFLRKNTDRNSANASNTNVNENIIQLIHLVSKSIDWSVINYTDENRVYHPDNSPKPIIESANQATQKYCELTELQAMCYTEIISLLQGVVANHQDIFDYDVISESCQALLNIAKHLTNILTTNPSVVINYVGGQPFNSRWFHNTVESLFRALFHSWSSAKIKDREMWIQFQKIAIQSTLMSQVTSQWSIVMKKVTHILASQLFGLSTDYNSSNLHDLMSYGTRRKAKSGLRSSNSVSRLRKQNQPNGSDTRTAEPMTRVTSGPAILTESTSISSTSFLTSRKKKANLSSVSKRDAGVTISEPSAFIHNDDLTSNIPTQSKDGFELFSSYYKTIVAPSLPRSSVSSTHSGGPGLESTPSIDSRLSDSNINEPIVIGTKAGVYTYRFSTSPKSQIDLHLTSWNEEEAVFIWKNILSCLGDINSIKDPNYHSIAIQTVVLVYDALENVRSYKAHSGPPVPCSFEMAIWIIYAVDLPALYNDGRLLAYEWMCRAISNRQPNQKILNAYNPSFYRQLLKGLSRQNFQLFEIILKNTTLMFSRILPGVNVLAPAFIVAIRGMLIDQNKGDTGPKVLEIHRQLALTILTSMIHLPYHFSGLQFPLLSYKLLMQGDSPKMIHVNEIKNHILFILLKLVESDEWSHHSEKYPSTYAIILNALTLQISYEMLHTKLPHLRSIRQCLTSVLDQLYSNQPSVVNVAVDCIEYLTCLIKDFYSLDHTILTAILEDIAGALNVHLNLYSPQTHSEQIRAITRLFTALTEWLLAIPPECVLAQELINLMASIFDRGMRQEHIQESPTMNEDQPANQTPKNPIKDTAFTSLNHLLAFFGNHKEFHGGMDAESSYTEPELNNEQAPKPTQFFALNGSSIVSFSQSENGSLLILVRNFLGKYQWEFNSINILKPAVSNSEEDLQELKYEFVGDVNNGHHLELPIQSSVLSKESKAESAASEDNPYQHPQNIEDVMNYIEKAFSVSQPDWIYQQPDFTDSEPVDLSPLDSVPSTPQTPSLRMSKPPRSPYLDLNAIESPSVSSKFVLYRTLFSSFGLTSPSQFRNGNLVPLQNGPALIRDLKALDRKPNREVIKIALIYVKPGQTSEEEILQNSTRSDLYDKFCLSLGKEILLSEHTGYLGGLEKSAGSDTTSIYYVTPSIEIMFHEVTRMPTDPNDSTQLKKKRHVGNDPVHIVWNESRGDYNPQTIGGDFGNVQIIVSPLPGGKSFDIRVYKDEQSSLFGPLMGPGIVVSDILAPDLVRSTAVAAYRTVLHHSVGHGHTIINPTMYRARDIETFIRKHPAPVNSDAENSKVYGFN